MFNRVRTPTSADVDSWAAGFANLDQSTTVPTSRTRAFAARIVELNARVAELTNAARNVCFGTVGGQGVPCNADFLRVLEGLVGYQLGKDKRA